MNNIKKRYCYWCMTFTNQIFTGFYNVDDPDDKLEGYLCLNCYNSDVDPPEPDFTEPPANIHFLGKCCNCESGKDVRNIIMLNLELPEEYFDEGWGCVVCDLPANGASAVLCDKCFEEYKLQNITLKTVCGGYPYKNTRIPFEQLNKKFEHDDSKHQEFNINLKGIKNENNN